MKSGSRYKCCTSNHRRRCMQPKKWTPCISHHLGTRTWKRWFWVSVFKNNSYEKMIRLKLVGWAMIDERTEWLVINTEAVLSCQKEYVPPGVLFSVTRLKREVCMMTRGTPGPRFFKNILHDTHGFLLLCKSGSKTGNASQNFLECQGTNVWRQTALFRLSNLAICPSWYGIGSKREVTAEGAILLDTCTELKFFAQSSAPVLLQR